MQRIKIFLAACVFLPVCIVLPAAAGEGFRWRIEQADELIRPKEPESRSMGGITWVSNSVYWAVTDWNPAVWELELPVDPASGKFADCSIRRLSGLEKAVDVEAIARDPLDGSIWIVDERRGIVGRYDPATGKGLGTVDLPPVLKEIYRDSGLESLSVSADGRCMWICTEEAVRPDGPRANRRQGTDVRLVRFGRQSADDPWKVSGEWIYRTDAIEGGKFYNRNPYDLSRSGISELCCLEDGTLLVLEREFSKVIFPRLRCRIYETDISSATDVHGKGSVTNMPSLKRVEKRLLFESKGLAMYEGMCVGPTLSDGSRSLLLVSDGDNRMLCSILSLRLYRIGVR